MDSLPRELAQLLAAFAPLEAVFAARASRALWVRYRDDGHLQAPALRRMVRLYDVNHGPLERFIASPPRVMADPAAQRAAPTLVSPVCGAHLISADHTAVASLHGLELTFHAMETGALTGRLRLPTPASSGRIALSASGALFAIADADSRLHVFAAPTWAPLPLVEYGSGLQFLGEQLLFAAGGENCAWRRGAGCTQLRVNGTVSAGTTRYTGLGDAVVVYTEDHAVAYTLPIPGRHSVALSRTDTLAVVDQENLTVGLWDRDGVPTGRVAISASVFGITFADDTTLSCLTFFGTSIILSLHGEPVQRHFIGNQWRCTKHGDYVYYTLSSCVPVCNWLVRVRE